MSVKDTGIGIAWEHQNRIFERFYRVDKSRSKATGGPGLGLAIVKHTAEYHKAKIELESSEGAGTEIKVAFPAKKSTETTVLFCSAVEALFCVTPLGSLPALVYCGDFRYDTGCHSGVCRINPAMATHRLSFARPFHNPYS